MLEQEYLNTVEDLIEMSRINANEMLTSYHLGSIIKSSIFTDMEEDWIPFIHPNYGWCHTFDPKDLVPMRMDFQSSGEQNGLIYLEMMFDVSVFNFHALEHLLTSHDTFQLKGNFSKMVDSYGNDITYFYVFVHENFNTRFDMAKGQKVDVGLREDIQVLFEKTNLMKINSETSKCNDSQDFFGYDNCKFNEVSQVNISISFHLT